MKRSLSRIISVLMCGIFLTACVPTSDTDSKAPKNDSSPSVPESPDADPDNPSPKEYGTERITRTGHPALFSKVSDAEEFWKDDIADDAVVIRNAEHADTDYPSAYLILDGFKKTDDKAEDSERITAIHIPNYNCLDVPRFRMEDVFEVILPYLPLEDLKEKYILRDSCYQDIWEKEQVSHSPRRMQYQYDYFVNYELNSDAFPEETEEIVENSSEEEPTTTEPVAESSTIETTPDSVESETGDESQDIDTEAVEAESKPETIADSETDSEILESSSDSTDTAETEPAAEESSMVETESEPVQENVPDVMQKEEYPQWISVHLYTDRFGIVVDTDILSEHYVIDTAQQNEWGYDYLINNTDYNKGQTMQEMNSDPDLDIPYKRPTGKPALHFGDQGDEVGWLQTALNKAMDCDLSITEKFDFDTSDKVREFQSRCSLSVDGAVGPQTIGRLVSILSGHEKMPPIVTTTASPKRIVTPDPAPPAETKKPPASSPKSSTNSLGTYVLNTSTMKIHTPNCRDVSKINEANKKVVTGSINDYIAQGYSTCGHCHPK